MTYGTIDIGTNTIRLLIAEQLNECKFEFLHQESRIARIGEGFGKEKIIKETALQRTKNILIDYKKIIKKFNVKNVFLAATSAVREAENKDWFLDNLKKLDFDIDVIDSKKEAYLTHRGIVYSIEDMLENKNWVAFDLGGGSTEFIFSYGNKLIKSFSIPLGGVKLLEMFIKNDPPTLKELNIVGNYFMGKLKQYISEKMYIDFIVGNAGTVTSLAAIDLKLSGYSYEKTEKYKLQKNTINTILNRLMLTNSKERLKQYKILEKGREDVIVVGAKVVEIILNFFNKDYLIVTNGSLREGLLIEKVCNGKQQQI